MSYSITKQLRLHGYIKLLLCLCLSVYSMPIQAQPFEWAKKIGGSYFEQINKVAIDAGGNVYVAGHSKSDTVDFNIGGSGGKFVLEKTRYESRAFLAKYDAQGNYLWAKTMVGKNGIFGGDDATTSVAVDGSGNVYIVGAFRSDTLDVNPGGIGGTLIAGAPLSMQLFLVKYDSDGKFLWVRHVKGDGTAIVLNGDTSTVIAPTDIAVDVSGNVYVTGYSAIDSADFNPGGRGGKVKGDVFLVKYDKDGNFLWAKGFPRFSSDQGNGVAVDCNGVYITGWFTSRRLDMNPDRDGPGGILFNAGSHDIFLARYDVDGNYLWAKSMGGWSTDRSNDVVVDGDGNAYITGVYYSDTIDFNPGGSGGVLTGYSGHMFLAKYDIGGNYLWAKGIGKYGAMSYGVAVDSCNNVYITGSFKSSPIDFNPGGSGGVLTKVSSINSYDVFLTKYDKDGNYLWAKGMGGPAYVGWSDQDGIGVAVSGNGDVICGGRFLSKPIDFNPGGSGGMLTPTGGQQDYDAFVVKYGADTFSPCAPSPPPPSSYLEVSLPCGKNSYTFNDSVYTAPGIYTQVFQTMGCDSTVTLELIFRSIDKPIIYVDSFRLSTGAYVTYQWLLNGKPIAGANDSVYTVTENGNYLVVVTNKDGCTDTSAVFRVTNHTTGMENAGVLAAQIYVYPNPADNMLYIRSPVDVGITLSSIEGKVIRQLNSVRNVSLEGLAEGIYFLSIRDHKMNRLIKVEKIVKQ